MAILKLEIELESFDDQCSIEDAVEARIIAEVTKRAVATAGKGLEDTITKMIDQKIGLHVNGLFEEFINQGFQPVDSWGEPKGERVSIKDMLKNRLDTFFTDKVNDKGEITSYQGKPRWERLVDNSVTTELNKFQKALSNQVVAAIKVDINEQARDNITKAIMSDYKLKELIK